MQRLFWVWSWEGKQEVYARDLQDAIAKVGNQHAHVHINGASEPNEVDLAAAARSEAALESALRERGWRPTA